MGDVRIRVIELMDTVLSAYDRKIGKFTAQQFKRTGAVHMALAKFQSSEAAQHSSTR
jgi:pyruvate/2-oxoglutarate dehydrogenase complex dihydrolipoamide dehydrogenase (E3) component